MQEMQKELSMNFPFFEPQPQPQNQNYYQQQQPGYYNQPQVQGQQDSYHKQDIFQKPSSGEDEIKVLNRNS